MEEIRRIAVRLLALALIAWIYVASYGPPQVQFRHAPPGTGASTRLP